MRHLIATTLLVLTLAACATLPRRIDVTVGNESVVIERGCNCQQPQ